MTGDQALAEIKRIALLINRINFTNHALDRMDERGATAADIQNALLTATTATYQSDRNNWRVTGGTDLDGDDLTVVVKVWDDVIVVTIF